jgi:hypothetical protein
LAADSISVRAKLEAKRTRIESGRQRNIDPVVKQIIGEDDARERIAELKVQRLQIESSSQHLGRFHPSQRPTLPTPCSIHGRSCGRH